MTLKTFVIFFTIFAFVGIFSPNVNGEALYPQKGVSAYEVLEKAGYGIEKPDNSHNPPVSHITVKYDETLRRYVFAFNIHALVDDDRGIASVTDRQRVEIKAYKKSPSRMIAREGDTLMMRWKMRLPEGFKTTAKFCHLHQLKGMDNEKNTADVKYPLITLTACTKTSGAQRVELRYFDRTSRKTGVKAAANLEEILGEWVEITERVTFGKNFAAKNNGAYDIRIIRLRDSKEILSFSSVALDLWQTDSAGLRPKWGIYRSLGKNRALATYLRDEEVCFLDFEVEKVTKETRTGKI